MDDAIELGICLSSLGYGEKKGRRSTMEPPLAVALLYSSVLVAGRSQINQFSWSVRAGTTSLTRPDRPPTMDGHPAQFRLVDMVSNILTPSDSIRQIGGGGGGN